MIDPLPSRSLQRVRPGRAGTGWLFAASLIALIVLLPVLALVREALAISPGLWNHLIVFVLPHAATQSALLLAGVGLLVALIGTSTAWLVTAYSFPGRRIVEWALLLPLAVPTYIIAYVYLDLLHPIGTLQDAIRTILGYSGPREFRLPDIRSLTGCIILLGFVLYPYVYITARAMFLSQSANLIDAARMLGVKRRSVFWRVALPLARPAIAVGVSLAMMETLNDIGASEFLGVRTLTISIYTTWIVRTDLAGAAQIAIALLLAVVLLVALERYGRRRQRFFAAAQRSTRLEPHRLGPAAGTAALLACFIPIMVGFIAPMAYLSSEAIRRMIANGISPRIFRELFNTVTVAAGATLFVLLLGTLVAYATRVRPGSMTQMLQRTSTIGYALPGTVLAIGILIVVSTFDRFFNAATVAIAGVPAGLLLIGSGAALVYAYVARFLAISVGSVEAGFSRLPLSYDHAARNLGNSVSRTFLRVHLPLSGAALASAGILVFVDCMKELPAALVLRPLNFETLATHIYGEAARGTYEEAAIAALAIVLAGIVPVILLARVGRTQRDVNQ